MAYIVCCRCSNRFSYIRNIKKLMPKNSYTKTIRGRTDIITKDIWPKCPSCLAVNPAPRNKRIKLNVNVEMQ
jgi:hypothetical protein